jgi:hypothetical protein
MDYYSLLEFSQLKAIHLALEPSIDSIFRIKCRDYSQRFHTPLHVVMNELDPMVVLEALYEEQYRPSIVEEELEELMDRLYLMKDPNYSRMTKEQTEDLVDAVLNREIERAKKKKAPTQQTILDEIKRADTKPQNPKSGAMDFSQLEKLESKSEINKSGFES